MPTHSRHNLIALLSTVAASPRHTPKHSIAIPTTSNANGGSPQKAQLEIQTSSVVRPLVLALIYIVLFRAKVCDPVAALLPLLFAQVAIKVLEFFRNDKKGGDTAP